MSCPSRGTWIEIHVFHLNHLIWIVVPLPGHVDRNHQPRYLLVQLRQSCPSRGTWIEMSITPSLVTLYLVVPLPGHVDRNTA